MGRVQWDLQRAHLGHRMPGRDIYDPVQCGNVLHFCTEFSVYVGDPFMPPVPGVLQQSELPAGLGSDVFHGQRQVFQGSVRRERLDAVPDSRDALCHSPTGSLNRIFCVQEAPPITVETSVIESASLR